MRNSDITKNIQLLYTEEVMNKLSLEVTKELASADKPALLGELSQLINKAQNAGLSKSDNVTAFKPRSILGNPVLNSFESVELLAAAGKSLNSWFSSPIAFIEFGFTMDIRKILGSETDIELYLSVISGKSDLMRSSLSEYAGKSVKIQVTDIDVVLLEAELYVDEQSKSAEGSGILTSANEVSVNGKLKLEILVNK